MLPYTNLKAEMARRGISNIQIAATMGVSEKTFRNKQRGDTSFTWSEVCLIQKNFFPDISKDALFAECPAESA